MALGSLPLMQAGALRNRLVMATAMWRQATEEPLPTLPPGHPAEQIETFELQLVDLLCSEATPETARETAALTSDIVHDHPDDDPVKRRVVECHERLKQLGGEGG